MSNTFFRINMPYGIQGNSNKGWIVFNREYKPLGMDKGETNLPFQYVKYPKLNDKIIDKLANLGCYKDNVEDEYRIIFYLDRNMPSSKEKFKDWANYNRILKLLSEIEAQ